jgi:NADPH:quinone reductase-like Zn-dependent oxidoreductase
MRALLVDPESPAGLRLSDAPDSESGPGQALIEVRHSSLTSAELYYARISEPGTVLGFDAAGVVEAAAAAGRLTVQLGCRAGRDRIADAAEALAGRRLAGKAVIDITHEQR